jgi:hypothetical protein
LLRIREQATTKNFQEVKTLTVCFSHPENEQDCPKIRITSQVCGLGGKYPSGYQYLEMGQTWVAIIVDGFLTRATKMVGLKQAQMLVRASMFVL